MTVNIFRHNITHEIAAYYTSELNSVMCIIEGFCYINKIPYSFRNPVIMPDKTMTAFIKLRHKEFEKMDSKNGIYVTEAVIHNMTADMLMTIQDD